jgi:hypothetical protein
MLMGSTKMNFPFEVRDPVYGFIGFNEWEKEIIAHPFFQRLRRIRQLALTDMVYPGATYSRFEHSLGAMHLATLMYDAITQNDQNLHILKDKRRYQAAGISRTKQYVNFSCQVVLPQSGFCWRTPSAMCLLGCSRIKPNKS